MSHLSRSSVLLFCGYCSRPRHTAPDARERIPAPAKWLGPITSNTPPAGEACRRVGILAYRHRGCVAALFGDCDELIAG